MHGRDQCNYSLLDANALNELAHGRLLLHCPVVSSDTPPTRYHATHTLLALLRVHVVVAVHVCIV